VYSLGATLYHLLTGQPPASAQDRFLDPQVLPLPRELNPAVSPEVEQAVMAALALHPNDRPPSVDAWAKMLGSAAPTSPVAAAESRAIDSGWGQALRENWWLALIALAAVAAAVILTFR